jgi:hypothetical protein
MTGDQDLPLDEAPDAPDGLDASPPVTDIPLPPPPDGSPRCSWCSAPLDDPATATCPSCGALLVAPQPVDLPGVTTVDPAISARVFRPIPERRGLAFWFTGDDAELSRTPSASELPAIARPDVAVRREMLRMELAAQGIIVEDEPTPAEPADDAQGGEEAPQGGETPPSGPSAEAKRGHKAEPSGGSPG